MSTVSPPPPPPPAPPPAPAPSPAPAPAPPVYYLPFDLTGILPSNTQAYEFHNVQMGQKAIVRCDYGPFYANSPLQPFQLYAQGAGQLLTLLTPDVDYRFAELDPDLSRRSGMSVYQAVVVLNTTLSGVYAACYQAVGGEDHPNVGLLTQQANAPTALSAPIAFSSIQKTPATYVPSAHQHDALDYYGAEYIVNALGVLKQAITARFTPYAGSGVNSAQTRLALKVSNFITTLSADATLVQTDINQHIANTGFPHAYTKAMIGLGNVQDGAFIAVGSLPIYASPYTVGQAIAHPPAYTPSTHSTLINNPHVDTAATLYQGALDKVRNLPVVNTYVAGDYTTLFAEGAAESYLTTYETHQALAEAQAAQVQTLVTAPLATLMDGGGPIAQAQAANTGANIAINSANSTLTSTSTSLAEAQTAVTAAQAANRHFNMVLGNAEYAALLQDLLLVDYAAAASGESVSGNGYYSVPPLIDNLYLWLDVGSIGNTYRTDGTGQQRLMTLSDRSVNARQFAANNLATAPLYAPSQDVTHGVPGLTLSNVAQFVPGTHLDQISGPAVSLTPGMTIFALVRSGASGVPFPLLTDIAATPLASIVLQPTDGVALAMRTGLNWLPFLAAPGTLNVSQSALIAAGISPEGEAYNWLATSNPRPSASPTGAVVQGTPWPAAYVQSAPMTRIGNASVSLPSGGELSQLLIYNRLLSFKEAQAVLDYLRLVSSHNLAFTVDTSAQNAF